MSCFIPAVTVVAVLLIAAHHGRIADSYLDNAEGRIVPTSRTALQQTGHALISLLWWSFRCF